LGNFEDFPDQIAETFGVIVRAVNSGKTPEEAGMTVQHDSVNRQHTSVNNS